MKKQSFFLSILLLLSTQIVFASANLADLDSFLSADKFVTAFHPNDTAVVEKKSCVAGICDTFQLIYKVVSATETEAKVRTEKLDGTLIAESLVTKADWENSLHNRLRLQIKSLESYGFIIEIKNIESAETSIQINGQMQNIETRLVTLSGRNGAGMTTTQNFEISSGIGAIAQFLRTTEKKTVGTESSTILRVTR